jgi:hypothetical protein
MLCPLMQVLFPELDMLLRSGEWRCWDETLQRMWFTDEAMQEFIEAAAAWKVAHAKRRYERMCLEASASAVNQAQ